VPMTPALRADTPRRQSADPASEVGADPRSGDASQPRPWWRDALRRRMLAAADLCVVAIAVPISAETAAGAAWAFATAPLWILLAKLLGLYDRDHRALRHLTIDELPAIARWTALGVGVMVLLSSVATQESPAVSRFLLGWGVAAAAALALRALARWLWRRVTPPEVTVIVGDGGLAAAIGRKLKVFRDMHLSLANQAAPIPIGNIRSAAELDRLARAADRLIVATESLDPELVEGFAGFCRERQLKLSVVSPLRGRAGPMLRLSQVADLTIMEYDTWDISRSTMLLKRAFDVVISACLLTLLSPLVVLIATVIRLDSRGSAIFSQLRAGLGGRPFRMLKFRTMTSDAEARLGEVVSLDQLTEPMFKVRDDPRVTRVGRLLRKMSLDELPQLFNVLKGDMSVVGPRPEQLEVVERYRPEHRFRLAVKPGITGPMQVFGRGELTFAERLAVEQDYIENMSIGRDLRILAMTVPAVGRGTGAF
jgi:exopolysaccharide biosynthesis polyprenyl glycosylphosphotransferase